MEINKEKKIIEKAEKVRKVKLAEFINAEYERRREERKGLEAEWKLNARYLEGDQYCDVVNDSTVESVEADFYWQPRRVYNHIAPIIEARLAKLERVRPSILVKPNGDDEMDYLSAEVSEKAVMSAYERLGLDRIISKVTTYAEVFGTGFYKIIWNNNGGGTVDMGSGDQLKLKEGDISITAVMPFAIYPDSLYNESLKDCRSLIHACVMKTEDIKELYGVSVAPEKGISAFLSKDNITEQNAATVIEYYERANEEYPNGKMITVCGNCVLYEGELPFLTGENESRDFPFVKQNAFNNVGKFFGSSVIKRLIPVQRAYNAVKNRKQEFLNRISMGVLTVEDGSVDTDGLQTEGLQPGKVLVYRQGANKPEMMNVGNVPNEFGEEETNLLLEFDNVSGVSDLTSKGIGATAASGTALQLLFTQESERSTLQAENVRSAIKQVYRHILRLYKQFAYIKRKASLTVNGKETEYFYFTGKDLTADRVELAGENELLYTPVQKKSMLLQLYNSGLLNKDSNLSDKIKSKLLNLLGYGDLDDSLELRDMHWAKATEENVRLNHEYVGCDEIDEHNLHIESHTRYYLSEHEKIVKDGALKERLVKHILEHKAKLIG